MLRISTVVDTIGLKRGNDPLEVLRISTVVDRAFSRVRALPLEVLRISTVVDHCSGGENPLTFGSAKNFYCCR